MNNDEISRLKKLSGIEVADELMSDDDVADLENQKYDEKDRLEKAVSSTILETFNKAGFEVQESEHSGIQVGNWRYDVTFDSDTGEGTVYVESCTAQQVSVLQTSGLADEYRLTPFSGSICFEFTVSPNIVNSM